MKHPVEILIIKTSHRPHFVVAGIVYEDIEFALEMLLNAVDQACRTISGQDVGGDADDSWNDMLRVGQTAGDFGRKRLKVMH